MPTPLRLIPIEAGWLSADTAVLCEGATGRCRVPVESWLIEHAKGTVLFDTGLHEDLVSASERIAALADVFIVDMQHGLRSAIEARGFDPATIDYIVFSHLHFDRSGGTHAVPNARIIVQAEEWQAAYDEKLVARGVYNPRAGLAR